MPEIFQNTLVVMRPPHFPTLQSRETARHLGAFGLDELQACVILRCNEDDFRRYYKEDFETGLVAVNAQVQAAVLHQALHERDVPAMKLWLINKAGWRAGDAPRGMLPPGQDGDTSELTVVQRRTVIDTILTRVTQEKRRGEKVVDGRVIAQQRGTSVGSASTTRPDTVARAGSGVVTPGPADSRSGIQKSSNGTVNGDGPGNGPSGGNGAAGNGTRHR